MAINRATLVSPALAALLLRHGRYAVGPMVEQYLQIRVLLGERPPPPAQRILAGPGS